VVLWFASFNLAQDISGANKWTEFFYILWVQIWFNSSWLPFPPEIGGSNFRLCSTLYLIALIALTPALARVPVHTYWSTSDLGTISLTERSSCASPISKVVRHISDRFCSTLCCNCLVPRRALSRWKYARKGRRDGDNGRDVCTLPMVPCGSSPVTRVSRSRLRCEKRSAWGGGCPGMMFDVCERQPVCAVLRFIRYWTG